MCQFLTSVTCIFASCPVNLPHFTAIRLEIPSVPFQHLCQAELMLLSKKNISRGFSCWLFTSRSQERLWSNSLSDSPDCLNALHKFLQPRHWKNTLEIPKGWASAPQMKLGRIKRPGVSHVPASCCAWKDMCAFTINFHTPKRPPFLPFHTFHTTQGG